MYLILAIIWLVVGVGLIIHDSYAGNDGWFIPGLGWSAGWVCLLLSAYNFLRWWSRRQSRRSREDEYRARLQQRNYRRHPPPVRREPPDPNFNFTDEPEKNDHSEPKA
jgi:hypothetical protein